MKKLIRIFLCFSFAAIVNNVSAQSYIAEQDSFKTAHQGGTDAHTGIGGVNKTDDVVYLYPNPARNEVNAVFDRSLEVKNITIYNLIGKPVSVFKISGNSARMDIDNIPSGIYFIRLLDNQGRVVATRKFVHQ